MYNPTNLYQNMGWRLPTFSNTITSPYGWRTINGVKEFHNGFDLGAYFDLANAVEAGTVKGTGTYSDGTKYVTLQTVDSDPSTGNKLIVHYLHLSSYSVSTGANGSRSQ